MKALAYVVPIRPQICAACEKHSWVLLVAGDGTAPWISSGVIWAIVLALLFLLAGSPDSDEMSVPSAASAPTPQPTLAIAIAEPEAVPAATAAQAKPVPVPTPLVPATARPIASKAPLATTSPATIAVQTPKPDDAVQSTSSQAATRLQLRTLETQTQGDNVEIVIDSDADALQYKLTKSRFVSGYVLDLPGVWALPRGMKPTYDFYTGNFEHLRVGAHKGYLRLVLSFRDANVEPPAVDIQGGRIRILLK